MVSSGENRTKGVIDEDADSDADAAEDILEESPDKRWSKRRETVRQRDVPGIDSAFLAMDNETGNEVVWNEVNFSEKRKFRAQEEKIRAVFDNLTKLVHTNLVKLHTYWIDMKSDKPRIIFITEYMSSGSMASFLQRTRKAGTPCSIKAWKKWTLQILSALNYLHSSEPSVIHGNLTSHTVFIQQNGLIKIGCVAPEAIEHHVKTFRESCRLQYYTAPEYEFNVPVTTAADIWAFGICSLEIAVIGGLSGFQKDGSSEKPEDVIERAIMSLEDPQQQDFIRQCLRKKPEDRPTARQLLFHQILFEVHSLKLLSAHSIVDSKKYDNVHDSVFRIPDNEKVAAVSKLRQMAYCQVAAFQLDLEKFLDDVRNGIYPLTAFAPLAHQPTTLKLCTNEASESKREVQKESTAPARSQQAGAKQQRAGTVAPTTEQASTSTKSSTTQLTNGNGGANGTNGAPATNGSGTASAPPPSSPVEEIPEVPTEGRHILEISVAIEEDEILLMLLLEDHMHRQLTSKLTEEDTPESLTVNLMAHGFICSLDAEGVEAAILEAFEKRRRRAEDAAILAAASTSSSSAAPAKRKTSEEANETVIVDAVVTSKTSNNASATTTRRDPPTTTAQPMMNSLKK